MKFIIKTLIFSTLLLFTLANNLNSECDNPCVSCQRAVYQLKFHKIADCGESHCKNTCYKVRDLWNNSPDGIFKPFEKDIFGKCEICFRAGFCSIEECKAQQDVENDIIAEVVNKSTLTAKKNDFIGSNQFSAFRSDPLFYSPERLIEMDKEIEFAKDKIKQNLEASFVNNSAKSAIEEVKNVMNKLFTKDSTFAGKGVNELKNKLPELSPTQEHSAAQHYNDATKKYIDHVNKILQINQNSSKLSSSDKSKLNSLISKTKEELANKIKSGKKVLKASQESNLKQIKLAVKDSLHDLSHIRNKLNKA